MVWHAAELKGCLGLRTAHQAILYPIVLQPEHSSVACLCALRLTRLTWVQLEAARERERAMCEHAETVEARSRALSIELDIMQRRADRELAVQHEMEEQVRRLRASVMVSHPIRKPFHNLCGVSLPKAA